MIRIDNLRKPRVTVIIPVRNCINYIQEALDSVLSQTFSDLELLLIDDGSTDADYQQFESIDVRVHVTRLEGVGVSRARNTGMAQARGEFLAFLDADDVWFPGKLEAQVRYLDLHREVGVVFGGFTRWQADTQGRFAPAHELVQNCSNVIDCESDRSGWLYTRLLLGLLVGMNTAMIRREILDAIGGFNESMRQGEDYDFWLKASRVSEMHSLNAKVALYRIHPASAMHRLSPENSLAFLLKAAAMRWGLTGPGNDSIDEAAFANRLSQVDFNHAYTHFWKGDRKVARQSFWNAMRRGYMPVRCAAYLMLTLLPLVGQRSTS